MDCMATLFILPMIVIACWFFAMIFIGPVTYYDCDLCGRKKICRVREVGKASAGHLCDDCYRSEREALRRYNSSNSG